MLSHTLYTQGVKIDEQYLLPHLAAIYDVIYAVVNE